MTLPATASTETPRARRIIVAITGASGAIYGVRLLQVLQGMRESAGVESHLLMSPAGLMNVQHELHMAREEVEALAHVVHNVRDIGATIASGSFSAEAMVVAPCSMRTLAAVAHGLSDNLIARAADVTLKERRRLILMVRETPLNLAHLRNMTAVTEMGGIVFPPVPGFYQRPNTIDDLVGFGSISPQGAQFIDACVRGRLNVVVSGGTGTGKTTMLNILSSFIPVKERVVTIEDTTELQLHQDHVVTLESKPANVEGAGGYSIRDLVKNALRMRPDRIIVGECRGAEALDMLQAMNTGHDGSMTTVHANNTDDVIKRLEVLVLMAVDLPVISIHRQIASAIDVVVQRTRARGILRGAGFDDRYAARVEDFDKLRLNRDQMVKAKESGAFDVDEEFARRHDRMAQRH